MGSKPVGLRANAAAMTFQGAKGDKMNGIYRLDVTELSRLSGKAASLGAWRTFERLNRQINLKLREQANEQAVVSPAA